MPKVSLNTIGSRYGSIDALNDNFDAIEAAIENTLSLDGTSPNAMEAPLDMNSNSILNASTIYAGSVVIAGQSLEPGSASNVSTVQVSEFTATAGQTSFSVSPFTPSSTGVIMEVNGVTLPTSAISVTGSVVSFPALQAGDEGVIRTFTREVGGSNNASDISFLQSGAATSRTVQSKLRDSFSVKDFAVVGNGIADDTTAFQVAIDEVSAAGGGDLYVPNGTYSLGRVYMKDNVRLVGQGKNTILQQRTATLNWFFEVASVSNVGFVNLTFDLNNATGNDNLGSEAIFHRGVSVAANNLLVQDCKFIGGVIRPYIDMRSSLASRGVSILDCEFIGKSSITPATPSTQTQTTQAIRFLCVAGCGLWEIRGNTSKYCGLFIQTRSSSTQAFDLFDSVVVSDNLYTDALDDSNTSTSPYELFCITGLTVTGNTIRSGGRGYNAAYVKSATYSGNVAYDQTKYFLEMDNCDGVNITGNTAYNCKTFVNDTPTAGTSTNISILGNTMTGGSDGEVGYDYQTFTNVITMQPGGTYSKWKICGNTFTGQKYADSIVRIAGTATDMEVSDNTFVMSEETARPRAINLVSGSRIRVRGNTILRSANVTNTTLATNSIYSLIEVNSGATDVIVEDNVLRWTGSDTRTGGNNTGIIGIGNNSAAAAQAGIVVRGNTLFGTYTHALRLQSTTGDTVVENNDVSGATGAVTLNSAIKLRSVSVRDFGAKGDGVTDDTAAIQAAIDYAENNGGSIFIPSGNYLTSAELLIDKPGVELFGDGTGTTWDGLENSGTRIVGSHTTGAIVRIKWENCSIRKIVFDANATRQAASFGATKAGIWVEADDVAAPEGDVFSTVIKNVYVRNQPGDGILMVGRTYQSIVEDCYSVNNKGHGFCLDGGNRTSRTNLASPGVLTLTNVYCYYNEGHGIALGNSLDDGVTHASSLRVLALNCESSSNNVNTGGGIAYLDYDAYVRGDDNTFITCAFSGKNEAGAVQHHGGVAVAGRSNHFLNCRYLDPIYAARVFNGTGVTTVGTEFIGMSVRDPLNAQAVLTDSGTTWTKVEITDTTGLTAATSSETTDGIVTRIGKEYVTHGTFQVSDFKSTKTRTIADDVASQITFSTTSYGIAIVSGPTLASGPAIWAFRVGTSPYCYLLAGNATYNAATTGVMTGTTGVDGLLTLSAHTDNKLYLENRTGASRSYEIVFLSVNGGRLLPGS